MRYFNLLRNLANGPLYPAVQIDLSRRRSVGMLWGWREDRRYG